MGWGALEPAHASSGPHLHLLAVVQQHIPQLLGDHVKLTLLPFCSSGKQIHPRERRVQGIKLPVNKAALLTVSPGQTPMNVMA